MVLVSNVDLIMAALRSRLKRVSAEKRSAKAAPSSLEGYARSTARDPFEALAAMRQLPHKEFERTFVRAVLEAELGESLSEDPRFARLIDETHRRLLEARELRDVLRQ